MLRSKFDLNKKILARPKSGLPAYLCGLLPTPGASSKHIVLVIRLHGALVDVDFLQVDVYTTRASGDGRLYVYR